MARVRTLATGRLKASPEMAAQTDTSAMSKSKIAAERPGCVNISKPAKGADPGVGLRGARLGVEEAAPDHAGKVSQGTSSDGAGDSQSFSVSALKLPGTPFAHR